MVYEGIWKLTIILALSKMQVFENTHFERSILLESQSRIRVGCINAFRIGLWFRPAERNHGRGSKEVALPHHERYHCRYREYECGLEDEFPSCP